MATTRAVTVSLTLLSKGIPGWRFEKRKDPTFQFLEKPHDYLLNGERMWSPSSGLHHCRFIDTTYYKPEHAHRGTYVHWACRLMDEDDLDWKDIAPEYLGYVEAYAEAKIKWRIRSRFVEKPIYHPEYRYGVTPDREAIILDGDPAIVELKTGTMMDWTRYQTAAQDMAIHAWEPNPEEESGRRRIGIELKSTGKFRVKEFDDPDDYDTWRACLKVCQRYGQPPKKLA